MQIGPDTIELRPLSDESEMLIEKNGVACALVHFVDGRRPVATPGVHGGAERVDAQIVSVVLASL